jgi:hypothetical protein
VGGRRFIAMRKRISFENEGEFRLSDEDTPSNLRIKMH